MKSEREIRKCTEFRTANEEEYVVEGYATTYNTPYTLYDDGEYELREVIESQAFENCDMTDVIMQYDHEGRVFARNKNGTLELASDEHGLKVTARLGGTEIGRQLYQEIKGGYTDKMSFAFIVSDDKRDQETRDGKTIVTRRITGIRKLYDVSAVSLPANDTTSINARSWCDGEIARLEAERLSALEESRRKLALKIKISTGGKK